MPYLKIYIINNDNFCCGNKGEHKGDGITDNEDPELNQFYYHSDHLGSSSYITNLNGSIVQHVEYVPFGEVFLEERNNKWNTPYLFNGKELDEETGLYYYGARYYSSRNSIFLSVDPLWEEKPNFSPYNYCSWNPVMRVDPDGRLDDNITVNSEGVITKVVETEEPNKFYDESDNQLFLNDVNSADKKIATKEDFSVGDRLYYPLSKSDIHSAINDVGATSTWVGTAWESYTDADFTYSFLGSIVADDSRRV